MKLVPSVWLFFIGFKRVCGDDERVSTMLLDGWDTCVFRLSGGVDLIFYATTETMDGETVYQAYDPETCEPLKRYLYRWQNNGKPEWNIDSDLEASVENRLGIVETGWSGCDTSEKRAVLSGQTVESKLTHYTGLDCDVMTTTTTTKPNTTRDPNIDSKFYEILDVDMNNACKYYQTLGAGHPEEELKGFIFYPTTSKVKDEAIYQAYDLTSCLPYPKFLELSELPKNVIMTYDFKKKTKLIENMAKWVGCAKVKDEVVVGFGTTSSISYFDGPFCPNVPVLQIDKANKCSYRVEEDTSKYFFRPTTSVREDQVVFQAYDEKSCTEMRKYMYYYRGRWVTDDNLFPYDGIASDSNIGSWYGCNNSSLIRSSPFMRYWGGPGCDKDWPETLPLEGSTNNCRLDLEITGKKRAVFYPTTERVDAATAPVYQGFDKATCKPLEMFAYQAGDHWNLDSDLDSANGIIGTIKSSFTKCEPGQKAMPIMIDGKEVGLARMDYGKHNQCIPHTNAIVKNIPTTPTPLPIRKVPSGRSPISAITPNTMSRNFEVYDVDVNNSCKYYETLGAGHMQEGLKGFIFYPTTRDAADVLIYQAYDLNSCLPYPKFLRPTNVSKRAIVTSSLNGEADNIEVVDTWVGCAKFENRVVMGMGTSSSTMSYFDGPFCPNNPALQVDTSYNCTYHGEADYSTYFFLPTKSRREGEVVFQAYHESNCTEIRKYMYTYHGQWVMDDNLFPYDGVAPDSNIGSWSGCNKSLESSSPLLKYWGGPACKII